MLFMTLNRQSYVPRFLPITLTMFSFVTSQAVLGTENSAMMSCAEMEREFAKNVSVFDLIVFYFRFMLFSIGKDRFADDSLITATFYLQRIVPIILTPQDVDTLKMSYTVHVSHSACLSPEAFYRFIVPSSSGFEFNPTVYFHPNVRVDGWVQLYSLHQISKQKHDTMMDRKEEEDKQNREKEELRKAKGKGKERETGSEEQEGDGEGSKKAKPFVRLNFPDFPSIPRFWDHPVRGSAIGLWPPRFFDDWIECVSNGKELCLDPAPGNIAGPSGCQQPPHPPSPPPNITSRPLPSPPANTTPPGIADEYDTFADIDPALLDGV